MALVLVAAAVGLLNARPSSGGWAAQRPGIVRPTPSLHTLAARQPCRILAAMQDKVEAPDPADDEGASISQSTFNLVKNVAGAGVLSLPAGVAAGTGLAPALIILVALGSYSAYTFNLLGRMCEKTGQTTFKGLGEATRGPQFGTLMDVCCTLKTFFSCLAYSLVIADSFSAILCTAGAPAIFAARNSVLFGITGCILLPLCLLRNLAVLSYTSLLGSGAMLYTTIFMVIRLLDGSYRLGGKYHALIAPALRPAFGAADPWRVSVKSLVLACSLSTAFIAHYNSPKFYASLRQRSAARFSRVTSASFGIAIVLFAAITCAGFLTFGTASQGLILNNCALAATLAFPTPCPTLLFC